MSIPTNGRFVWYDLNTTDLEAAKTFYTELFGWNVMAHNMGEAGDYDMINLGGQGIGGMMPVRQEGIPSHWISYITVDDVDAAVERAGKMGGQVLMPAMDIPEVGRFAVVADGQGACFSPFKFAGEFPPEAEGPPPAGQFCWNELLTTDVDAAKAFYGEVIGWTSQDHDMGELGAYTVLNRGEKMEGGIMKMPPEAKAPPHWLPYVNVGDVDATAARVTDLGGCVHCPPTDIPGVGRFAVAADPSGAAFAIFKSANF